MEKKLWPFEDTAFFPIFSAHTWGEPFGMIAWKPGQTSPIWLNFWYFFTKKGPGNIAALRLKIGRTYLTLQPIEATMGWNLNQLFWPLPRWPQTFGLVCLAGQKNMFQLEFLAHFRTRGRAYAHVFDEVFGFQIACIEKKLWPFEYTPFFPLFSAHTWWEPFGMIAWKPGQTSPIWLNFGYFLQKGAPVT